MLTVLDEFEDGLIVKCPCGIEFSTPKEKYSPKLRCAMCTSNLKKRAKGRRAKADTPLAQLYDVFFNLYTKMEQDKE